MHSVKASQYHTEKPSHHPLSWYKAIYPVGTASSQSTCVISSGYLCVLQPLLLPLSIPIMPGTNASTAGPEDSAGHALRTLAEVAERGARPLTSPWVLVTEQPHCHPGGARAALGQQLRHRTSSHGGEQALDAPPAPRRPPVPGLSASWTF